LVSKIYSLLKGQTSYFLMVEISHFIFALG